MQNPIKIIFGVGISLLLLFFLAYYGVVYHTKNSSVKVASAYVNDCNDPLQLFSASDGSFKAAFPSKPNYISGKSQAGSLDERNRYEIYMAKSRLGSVFMINIVVYSEKINLSASQKILKNALNEIVTDNAKNSIVNSQFSTYKEFPSLDFVVKNDLAQIRGKAILKGNVLFVISVAAEDPEALNTHFDKFLASLQLGTT